MTPTTALFIVTAYAVGCDVRAGSPTKSGVMPQVEWTVAADPRVLPIGSIVHIEGVGERMVQDTGGAIKGRRLDLYVGDCREARQWGRQSRRVKVRHRGGQR